MKKLIPLFALLLLCFYSCKEDQKKTTTKPNTTPVSQQPIPAFPNANSSMDVVGGAHYICPQNCVGGTSGAQGNCPVCSTPLAHNQGFHSGENQANTQPPTFNSTTQSQPTVTNPAPPISGPNAAGEYHYNCPNGCSGGGDTAGKCGNCDGDLAHNLAYHN